MRPKMRQTVKTVVHAPMKIREPLLTGMLVLLLIGCNVAAGMRFTHHTAAPAAQQVSSIDE
jgi:hypothetical protein